MPKAIYVNLPVRDLKRATDFYEDIGFLITPQFSNEQTAAFSISESIFVMLHTYEGFGRFTSRPIADGRNANEVMIALQVETKREVNELVERAVAVGGREPRAPQDQGFMVERVFEDPDGHVWSVFWFDIGQLF